MWSNFKKILNLAFLLPFPSSVLISLNFSILLSWIILLEQWLISKWSWTQWWWTSGTNHNKCIICIGTETMIFVISECLPYHILTSSQTPSTLKTSCKAEPPVCMDLSGLSPAWQPSFSRWLGLSVTGPCIFSQLTSIGATANSRAISVCPSLRRGHSIHYTTWDSLAPFCSHRPWP